MLEPEILTKLASIDATLKARAAGDRVATVIALALLGLGLYQTFGRRPPSALVYFEDCPRD